jgi:hypothetical protein
MIFHFFTIWHMRVCKKKSVLKYLEFHIIEFLTQKKDSIMLRSSLLKLLTAVILALPMSGHSGTWQTLNNPPPFLSYDVDGFYGPPTTPYPGGADNPLVLTDGSVLVHNLGDFLTGEIWKLTPDINGSYLNGTWSQLASLPIIDGSQYIPFLFSSAVLADGRVVFAGGAFTGVYGSGPTNTLNAAIYDPVANNWSVIAPPDVIAGMGYTSSVVLADGKFMVQDYFGSHSALLDPATLTWSLTGLHKFDYNSFEGWTLLPNENVLTIDDTGFHAPYTVISTNIPGIGPFYGIPAEDVFLNSTVPTAPISGPAAVATPDNTACTPINDLTGKIGVAYNHHSVGGCSSDTVVSNMAAANAIAVIEIVDFNVPAVTSGGSGIPFSVAISAPDGATLVNAINNFPNLTVTLTQAPATYLSNSFELYNPKSGSWKVGGFLPISLCEPLAEGSSALLRPNGTVFAPDGFGADVGATTIYDVKKNSWKIGPKLPMVAGSQLTMCQCPDALLRNGNVLLFPNASVDTPPTYVYEFDGKQFIQQPQFPNATLVNPNWGRPDIGFHTMVTVLPTGQIMLVDQSLDVELYTPSDNRYNPAWAPCITKAPKKVYKGETYKISGIQFNGMSQASNHLNSNQSATNYPLVRITNLVSNHVFYCRTHDHSYMGVASSKKVDTFFDVPANIETGPSILEVVANGIPSKPHKIAVD